MVGGLPEFAWRVLPIHAGGRRPRQLFELPPHASLAGRIEVWSERLPRRRWIRDRLRGGRPSLPAELARALIGWRVDPEGLTEALVWCRRHPGELRATFRSPRAWKGFVEGVRDALSEGDPAAGPVPELDAVDAATLYQRLYWVARTAAAPTPPVDLLHVTAAGWAAIPALVHRRLHGTPLLLTEHGVYVREAYLAAARSREPAADRFLASRLARGLSLAAYAAADVISPVTEANAHWERKLGVAAGADPRDPQRDRAARATASPPPRARRVVSVGRIDPLKDVQTMLLVAADVLRQVPDARFEYWGPPTRGQEAYAAACEELRRRLRLGDALPLHGLDAGAARGDARRRRRADDEHLRGPADGGARGDGAGPGGRRDRRRRRAGRAARLRRGRALRRRRAALRPASRRCCAIPTSPSDSAAAPTSACASATRSAAASRATASCCTS